MQKHEKMSRGKLIVVEGIDGSGKTTLVSKMLVQSIQQEKNAVKIHFPDRTNPIGALLDDYLTKKVQLDSETASLLFAADRKYVSKEIESLLTEGHNVILDRYFYSGIAYGISRNGGIENVSEAEISWLTAIDEKCIRPDKVIFLDIEPAVCLERMRKSRSEQQMERFETSDFMTIASKALRFVLTSEKILDQTKLIHIKKSEDIPLIENMLK